MSSPPKKRGKGRVSSFERDTRLANDGARRQNHKGRSRSRGATTISPLPTVADAPAPPAPAPVAGARTQQQQPTVGIDLTKGGEFPKALSLVMKTLMNKNAHKDNVQTFSKDQFKRELDKIIARRNAVIKTASQSDLEHNRATGARFCELLQDRIPKSVVRAIGKAAIIDHFLSIWQVVRLFIYETPLHRTTDHDLGDWLTLMENIEAAAFSELEAERAAKEDGVSLKVPAYENQR